MDSQSISTVSGPAPGTQGQQGYVPPSTLAKGTQAANDAVVVKETKAAKDAKPEIEVRTRDPRSLQYQVDGSTSQVVATIVDESNKMVVVQIPNEEVLRIARAIDRMKGFLLEGKA